MIKNGLFVLLFIFIGSVASNAQTNDRIVIDDDIQLIHLQDSVFIHVSWHHIKDLGRFPSNGLLIIKNGQALMIDTPWDNDKTERLTRYLTDSMFVDLTGLIIGHFHDDCLGGLGYLQSIRIESIANSMTVAKCKEIGLPVPSTAFTDSLILDFNGERIECRYFGAGHSLDNITVWIPDKKILFGGCLVRSMNSKGLGYLSDAVVNDWDVTIEKVMNKYPEIKTVIPGHGDYGGIELLTYTIELVDIEKNMMKKNEILTKEVWKTVKAHNKAWSVSEDIDEQMKYVHDDILFVKPPFSKILTGKDMYREDYENWMLHAKVNFFREVDPVIRIYNNGNSALVTYYIDMSYKYDDRDVNDWKGIDMMILTKENGNWLIVSDMYARNLETNN